LCHAVCVVVAVRVMWKGRKRTSNPAAPKGYPNRLRHGLHCCHLHLERITSEAWHTSEGNMLPTCRASSSIASVATDDVPPNEQGLLGYKGDVYSAKLGGGNTT